MSQDDDQLVERVAMIIAKHVFTERASEWPYAGKEEEIRGRLQRAARAALSAMPQRELLAEALEALAPFATVGKLFNDSAGDTRWREAPLFYCGTREDPQSHTLTGMAFDRARATADKIRAAITQEKQT